MAKKKNSEGSVVEYESAIEQPAEVAVIEYDPAGSSTSGLEIQAAGPTADTIMFDDGLLKARDEVAEMLGGESLFASALNADEEPGCLGAPNITGIGVGLKYTAGAYTGDVSVKVFVREKAPSSAIDKAMLVPSKVAGFATDVEETGELLSYVYTQRFPRPVPCGVSCGHVKITAGTIGCLVVLNNNRLCILSNNHVLANENIANIGDAIIQPGRADGGVDPRDRIGVLERFVPITFAGTNSVDAAAAWTSFQLVRPQHVTYKMNPSPLNATLGMSVIKNGRTTQATLGIVTAVAVNNVRVRYTAGVATFNNQVIISGVGGSQFSRPGDSGSIIVTAGTKQPVALLFAGGPTHTIGNPIGSVVSALGIARFV
jgi:hypothetical protein